MLAKLFEFVGQQTKPAKHQTTEKHRRQGREDAFDAAAVKLPKTKAALVQVLKNDAADQIPRNHKKDVDTDEARLKLGRKSVKPQHTEHRHGPQAVNVWTVFGVIHGYTLCVASTSHGEAVGSLSVMAKQISVIVIAHIKRAIYLHMGHFQNTTTFDIDKTSLF